MFNAACGQSSRRTFRPAPAQTLFDKTRLSLAISALLAAPCAVLAAPVIGNGGVTSGVAAIVQQGNVTSINQSSHKATINWQSFSTAPRETVNFNQPNAASVTLNRVIGNEASVLQGALNANGQVFLLNSNGVLIGKTASINTAGFVASTLGLSDADFNSGHYRFESHGASQGTLINQGTIAVADGGYAALLGQSVTNQGVIVANKGTVSLNSGERITLNFNGDSLLNVSIDQGTLNALVDNQHAIQADGGQVILTARAADDVLGSQVNNSGIIQAQTLDDITGNITLYAHGGTAHINGTLDASAPQTGNGGFIETSGNTVNIADNAIITTQAQNGHTGTWLIDPTDFTVGAGGDISGAQLSNTLANNNVTIESIKGKQAGKGDIIIFDAVSWANNTLTLDAENDIHINNAMTISGENGQLVMNTHPDGDYHIRTKASYSGTVLDANGKPVAKQDTSGGIYGSITFTNENNKSGLTINGTTYQLIHNMDELANISGIHGHYALAGNMEGGTHTKAVVETLDGTFTGLGHVVENLTINAPDLDKVALIGESLQDSFIRDLGVVNASITGKNNVGALVGINASNLSHVYSSGTVSAPRNAGGLFGSQLRIVLALGGKNTTHVLVSDSFSTADINAGMQAGGIAGWTSNITVSNSHSTGKVTSAIENQSSLGGLFGYTSDARIINSYATGNVTGNPKSSGIGGLVGDAATLYQVAHSFASGDVMGGYSLGGLIGKLTSSRDSTTTILNSHALGDVTGAYPTEIYTGRGIGGLIGYAENRTIGPGEIIIDKSSATGNVTFNGYNSHVGGLVGYLSANSRARSAIINSWASGNVTNNSLSSDTTGGLIGSLSHSSVIGSYATGNVVGPGSVGGLIGFANLSSSGTHSIDNSYAIGTASGGIRTGGLIGSAGSSTINNSYWNAREGQDGFGLISANANVNGSQGLDAMKLPDAEFYADGTIDAVLAARADETARIAAALQARMDTAGQYAGVLGQVQQTATEAPYISLALASPVPPIVGQLAFFTAPQGFAADIEKVDADGAQFDLGSKP